MKLKRLLRNKKVLYTRRCTIFKSENMKWSSKKRKTNKDWLSFKKPWFKRKLESGIKKHLWTMAREIQMHQYTNGLVSLLYSSTMGSHIVQKNLTVLSQCSLLLLRCTMLLMYLLKISLNHLCPLSFSRFKKTKMTIKILIESCMKIFNTSKLWTKHI